MRRALAVLVAACFALTGCATTGAQTTAWAPGAGPLVSQKHTDPKPAKSDFREATPGEIVRECYAGDANRVQVIYAVASDRTDRYASVLSSLQSYVARVDDTFDRSAQKTAGTAHVRWVTDSSCAPTIDHAVIPTAGDDSFSATETALRGLGYTRTDRHYLVFVDASYNCGTARIVGDSRPGQDNRNNSTGNMGVVGTPCWSAHTPSHELAHTLGAVQNDAPHSTGGYHCWDGIDVMCYNDGASKGSLYTSSKCSTDLLDCNGDDYFLAATPAAGNYLATHWNVADSPYLEVTFGGGGGPTPTPSPTPTMPSPTPTTPSPTPTTPSPTPTTASPTPTPTVTPSPTPTPTPTKAPKPCGKSHRPGCR